MSNLFWFVIIYWVISVGIGLYAGRFVKGSGDYANAGRSLPMYVVTATVFATWFGSETVLGIPATFLKEGIGGVVADPFGASLCLILVGLFFARKLYRMNLLTLGDFYRNKYGRLVEVLVALAIVISYLGWVGAQISALGLVFNMVSGGAISETWGKIIGASTVMIYTIYGGMWSVAITDFIQMIVIVVGMLYIGAEVSRQAGGAGVVVQHAIDAGKFSNFWPGWNFVSMLGFVGALFTMMLGSIPQQDVFQRVASAKNEKIAGRASVLGGVMYFCFAFIPMFLAYAATLIDPAMVQPLLDSDEKRATQQILPQLILHHAPFFAQVMFFGALLSAIKSCASATLLAPSVTFAENILKPAFKNVTDASLLTTMRLVVFCFTILVTLYSVGSNLPIYAMVENAYKVTLVTAFVPLVFGLYWKRANTQGAMLSIGLGLVSWIGMEVTNPDAPLPPQLLGLIMSLTGMIVGSLMPSMGQARELEVDGGGVLSGGNGDAQRSSNTAV
ncbi:MAG: sodium:solute symporter family protein [Burkholderiaceae bacterium]